eukprot:5495660-Prymnesium_polylepis.1
MVGVRSQRVVYVHVDSRWPPQASVKGVRRAMCTFFNRRRQEHRTITSLSDGLFGSLDALESAGHDPHRAGVQVFEEYANRGPAADDDDEGEGDDDGGARRLAASEAGASDGGVALLLRHSSLSDELGDNSDGGLSGLDLAAFVDSALPSDDEGADEAISEEDMASLTDTDDVKARRAPPAPALVRARPRGSIASSQPLSRARPRRAPSSLWSPQLDAAGPPPRRAAVPPRPRLPGQVRLEADGFGQDGQD